MVIVGVRALRAALTDAARWRCEEDMDMEAVLTQMIDTTDARFAFALVLVDVHIQGIDAVSVFRITTVIAVTVTVLVHEVALWVPDFSSGGDSGVYTAWR